MFVTKYYHAATIEKRRVCIIANTIFTWICGMQ